MELIGQLAALSAAILWSFTSFIFTFTSQKMGVMQLNISRLSMASILLIITLFAFQIPFEVNSNQLFLLVLSGFVGLVLGDTFLFQSFVEVGPRVGMLIMSGNPALGAILAYIILGEILDIKDILGIVITLSGIFLVISESSDNKEKISLKNINFKGVLWGFLAALGQAIGLILAKMAFSYGEMNGLLVTFIRIFSSVILFIPILFFFKKQFNPIKLFISEKKIFGFVVLGSIIGPYLGISLSILSIKYVHIGVASTLMSLVPIIMLPIAHFLYKEKLTKIAIIGAFITVIGCLFLFY
jgi:drug/metabolite transporter (DMT)-like permease